MREHCRSASRNQGGQSRRSAERPLSGKALRPLDVYRRRPHGRPGSSRPLFDTVIPDSYYGERCWEQTESKMLKEAIPTAFESARPKSPTSIS